MNIELIEDVITTRTRTTPEGTTQSAERTVRLRITDAPGTLKTGYRTPREYRVEALLLKFWDGALREFVTTGSMIKKDGKPGLKMERDSFYPDGRRHYYSGVYGDAPAWLLEIVKDYR